MTVIIVDIGHDSNTINLDLLATYPSRYYAIKLSSFTELLVSTSYIASVISSVPPYNIGRGTVVTFGNTLPGTYYTVQFFPNHFYTLTNDSIILFTWNCPACSLYASLSEPNPSQTNTILSAYANSTYPSGYAMSYFRLPKNTQRLFLSLMGTGQNLVTGAFQVFSTATMTKGSVIGNNLTANLSINIG
ncbi:hypothetical protein I4U23_016459 [Adineta vaga]|nr:hypothetical protein I4U23_016459 [Adineta vaga]